jgi:transposase
MMLWTAIDYDDRSRHRQSVFQVHGVEASPSHSFFREAVAMLIGIEACASSHYWSRELQT